MVEATKNCRLIAAMLLAVPVLAGCDGAEDSKTKSLDRGVGFYEMGNYDKAIVEFKNVLSIDPKAPQPYFYIGDIAEKQKDLRQASQNYAMAVKLDPGHIEANIRLGRFEIQANELEKASVRADGVLKREPGNADAIGLKAAVLYRQGKTDDAVRLLVDVLDREPGNKYSALLLATIYEKLNKVDQSLAILERANEVSADSDVMLRLLPIYEERKESGKAEKILLDLVKANPGELQYLRSLSIFYSRRDEVAKGVQALRNAIAKDPGNPQKYLLLIDLYNSGFSQRKAIAETRKMIENNPDMTALKFGLARLYSNDGQQDKAEAVYQGVMDSEGLNQDGLTARTGLARIKFQQGSILDGEKLIAEVLKKDPKDGRALLLKAKLAMRKKDYAEAITLLDKILAADDSSIPALRMKAKILTLKRHNIELEKVFTRLVEASPDRAEGYLGKGVLYRGQKKYSEALQAFEDAYTREPDSAAALTQIVEIQIILGDSGVAERRLDGIILANPRHPLAHELLGAVYMSRGEYQNAEQSLTRQLEFDGFGSSVYRRLANARLLQGNSAGAIQVYHDGHEKFPDDVGLLVGLVRAYLMTGDISKAAGTAEEGIIAAPDNPNIQMVLASVREKQGRYDDAISIYEQLLRRAPDNVAVINNLASLLAADYRKDDKQSLNRAGHLVKKLANKKQPVLMDTRGWVYYRLGDYAQAEEVLTAIVKQVPDNNEFKYHLGMTYYRQDKLDAARELLYEAISGKSTFDGMEEAKRVYEELAAEAG
ncbi:tetratricopeptide repeat protein [Pseudomonadota bacterium]